jgi:CheY-like chemotaxis protein
MTISNPPTSPLSSSNGHILVVDDSETNREILRRKLEAEGYSVEQAENGQVALDKIAGQAFDLVLLDVMMPGMSGLEVLEKLRETYSLTDLPVVMQTAKSDSETIVEALKIGANDYVEKGRSFDEFMARVGTHLNVRERSATAESGFAKLSGSRANRPMSSRYYCPNCTSSVSSEDFDCSRCSRERPDDGWPEVKRTNYPYLGSILGGRYFVSRFIGRGSSASVYQARDLELNRQYAVKIVNFGSLPEGVSQEHIRERILREIEVISKLSNPHIVKVYDVVALGDDIFALLLDFVQGHTLETILDRLGRLAPLTALDIMRQAAQGLHEAHDAGVIHCDVKPENIMVERLPVRGYFAHVLDFGVAELLDFTRQTGEYMGTPLYSAPEQFKDNTPIDHRVDIYGLGATLFHCIAGEPPFSDESALNVAKMHLSDPVPSLADIMDVRKSSTLKMLDDLLARMLAKNPDDRFADFSDFIDHIDAIEPVLRRELDNNGGS